MKYEHCNVSELLGKTLVDIESDKFQIEFTTSTAEKYLMYHEQDCCECVYIEDICGDLNDLLNSEILEAEDISSTMGIPCSEEECNEYDSVTWTFYKIGTRKGSVTIRWCGTSNGYYSESADFAKVMEQLCSIQ